VEGGSSFRGVADRVQKIETGLYHGRGVRAVGPQIPTPAASTTTGVSGLTTPHQPQSNDEEVVKAKRYDVNDDDNESIKFLRDLAAVTKLGKGGIRVKTVEKNHLLEIVDEYPAKAGEGLNAPHNNDGADLVKVRTEYYDQGSRTTKEVTHHDGSRTVVTTINSLKADDSISTKRTKDSEKRDPEDTRSVEEKNLASNSIVRSEIQQKNQSSIPQRSAGKKNHTPETTQEMPTRKKKSSSKSAKSNPKSSKSSKKDTPVENGSSF
jgi:hypothetical protein